MSMQSQATPSTAATPTSALKIRYGRLVIALLGVVALAVALVSGVVAAIIGGPVGVWLTALTVFVLCVATLRALAVQDRKRRQAQALAAVRKVADRASVGVAAKPDGAENRGATQDDAATPAVATPAAGTRPAPTKDVFDARPAADAQDSESQGSDTGSAGREHDGAAQEALSQEKAEPTQQRGGNESRSSGKVITELRTEAKTVTKDDLRAIALAEGGGKPWQPVQLPKPLYTQAAQAKNPAPQPLPTPEQPKPEGEINIAREEKAKQEHGRFNLDQVLQRRRA